MTDLEDYRTPDGYGTIIGKCLTFAEIEGLLAAERERCAAVAESLGDEAERKSEANALTEYGFHLKGRARAAWEAAEAIRNLPPQTEGSQS